FSGATSADVVAAILQMEMPPLEPSAPEAAAMFERIVTKALRKEPEERYQTAEELLVDLKDLQRRLELQADLASSERADARGESRVRQDATTSTTSTTEILISEVKRHKRGV